MVGLGRVGVVVMGIIGITSIDCRHREADLRYTTCVLRG